jgi:flagellar hook-associated protein 3 FlgL
LISKGVTGSVDLSPSLTAEVRLSDLNGGQGVNPGAIEFSNGTSNVVVDLASAETVQDVLDGINSVSLDGRPVQATLSANGLVINFADALPGTIRIRDSGSGRAAKNLGIATNVASPPLPNIGSDLNPTIRNTTLLSQLNNGAGLNVAGGFRITQGEQAFTVDLTGATTVDDALIAINNSGASVIADIAPGGRSLRIRSTESGSDFTITENLGTLATDLGLRTFHGQVPLSSLNHGLGLELANGPDLTFTRSDGTEFSVDLNSAVTVQDVIDLVNNSPDNQDPNLRIVIATHPLNNSLTLRSAVPPPPIPPALPAVPIRIRSTGGSTAAVGLGLTSLGENSATATIVGTDYYIEGRDPNPQETFGIFNTVIRMRDAVEKGDIAAITRASQLLDKDLDRIALTRGDLGIRQQRIESLTTMSEDSITELKSQESNARDADIASVISELTARQAAYESNIKLLAQNVRRTIFDFI